jgi:hypothetical protein
MAKHTRDMMVWTWAGWEPLQYYRRLGGFHEAQEGNALWADDWRALLDSEECAATLDEAGINWVTTHFYKGFGLDAEAEEIAATERMISNYHQHGVKVFTYIQYGTTMPETIEDGPWQRLDWNGQHDGHPYEYGDQYWRAKPCANQPGFRDYLLKVVDRAIEIGADGIWIDNLQADGCHCEFCQTAFRSFVQQQVSDPWRELGLPDLSRIAIPRAERSRDPLYQLWVRFRCAETRTSLKQLCDRARDLKPDIVTAVNVGIGNHQRAVIENGNWIGNLDCVDYTYAENGLFPAWTNGRMVTQHGPAKLAAAAGIGLIPGAGCVPGPRTLARVFTESTLFAMGCSNGPWGLRGENGGTPPLYLRDATVRQMTDALATFHQMLNAQLQCSLDAAPVGVFYSLETQDFDEAATCKTLDAITQLLLQNQIPFRYVLADRLSPSALTGLQLLILPHILPLAESAATFLRAFVTGGGRLLATGRCGLYDEGMRQRRNYLLTDLFDATFSNEFEREHQAALLRNPVNGCLFAPGSDLPLDRLVTAIRDTLAGEPAEVFCPVPHVGCEFRTLADRRLWAGCLNYADVTVRGIRLRTPVGRWASAHWCRADGSTGVMQPVAANGADEWHLPPLDIDLYVTFSPAESQG